MRRLLTVILSICLAQPFVADDGVVYTCLQETIETTAGESAYQVAISGADLFVGSARWDDDLVDDVGRVLHFRFDGSVWMPQPDLMSPTGGTNALFGDEVVAKDDLLLVASRGKTTVYRRDANTWTLEQELLHPTNSPPAFSIDGDQLAIATGTTGMTIEVWVLQAGVWVLDSTASPVADANHPNLVPQFFGRRCQISGDHLVVGDDGADDSVLGTNVGAVYHFQRVGSTWTQAEILLAATPFQTGSFGRDLALENELLAVGSTNSRLEAFALDANGLFVSEGLLSPAGIPGNQYASKLEMSGNRLVAYGLSGSLEIVHLFQRGIDAWDFVCTFASDGAGSAIDLAFDDGAVVLGLLPSYVKILLVPHGIYTDHGGGIAGSSGIVPVLRGSCPAVGVPFEFEVTGARPDTMGVILVSDAAQQTGPLFGSTMSPLTPYIVFEPHVSAPDGIVEMQLGALPSGHYMGQAMYLDPAAVAGVSISNALELNVNPL